MTLSRPDHTPSPAELTRRGVLGLTGAAALTGMTPAAGRAASHATAAAPRRRPNILWLVSEDNVPALGCYGDPVASTPTLDRLAEQGVRFDNAFSMAPVCAPSRLGLLTGLCPESAGPGQHHRAEAELPADVAPLPTLLRQQGYYCTNNSKTDYNSPLDPQQLWDESSGKAHWRNRPADAPFFAVFNDNTTHESNMFGAYAGGQTSPDDVTVAPYLPDTEVARRERARWYDNLAEMDGNAAVRLRELDDAGLADDTIVFYYGDNGGVLPRSKRFCYDSGLHVPLIVRFGRRWSHLSPYAAGSHVTRPVNGVDLPATVIDLAGATPPALTHGRSFVSRDPADQREYAFGIRNRMDETYDMQRTARDERYRYIRNYHPHRIYGQHVIYQFRQEGYNDWRDRYLEGGLPEVQARFWERKPAEELYDLRRDPDEIHNLADDPGHSRVLARLSRALDRHLLEVVDNGFIPEGLEVEGYDDSRREGAYPLPRVLEVARVASRDDAAQLPALVTALDDPDQVVRYWAALGTAVLGERARPALDRLRRTLAEDPAVHVRLQAAEALALLDEPGAPESVGAVLVGDPTVETRLQAANILAALGERARPAIEQIRTATKDVEGNVRTKARHALDVLEGRYPALG